MWSQPSLVEKVIISGLQFLIGAKYLELISANQPCGFTLVAVYSIDRPAIQGNTVPNAACYDIKQRSGNKVITALDKQNCTDAVMGILLFYRINKATRQISSTSVWKSGDNFKVRTSQISLLIDLYVGVSPWLSMLKCTEDYLCVDAVSSWYLGYWGVRTTPGGKPQHLTLSFFHPHFTPSDFAPFPLC